MGCNRGGHPCVDDAPQEARAPQKSMAAERTVRRSPLSAAMRRYVEAVVTQRVPAPLGLGDRRDTMPPLTAWSRQAEEYAQFLYLQPSTNIEDIGPVILMTEIEPTKNRKNAAPAGHPARSVALGLHAGFGNPIDSRVSRHYYVPSSS